MAHIPLLKEGGRAGKIVVLPQVTGAAGVVNPLATIFHRTAKQQHRG